MSYNRGEEDDVLVVSVPFLYLSECVLIVADDDFCAVVYVCSKAEICRMTIKKLDINISGKVCKYIGT